MNRNLMAFVAVLLAVPLYLMVNYLGGRHYQRFDWTGSGLYTLSEKSLQIVTGLDRDIEIHLILGAGAGGELFDAVDELLSQYQAANPEHIEKRVVDLAREPLEAERLAIGQGTAVVLESGDQRSYVNQFDLAEYDYSGAQFGQAPTLQAFKGEQLITSAILELAEDRKPKVVFTTGHGETTSTTGGPRALSVARAYFEQDNFEVEEWQSLGADAVPERTDLVVIAGPSAGFLESELELLSGYLDSGGRMLVLLESALSDSEMAGLGDAGGLSTWLGGYGIEVHDDFVVDPASQVAGAGPEEILTDSFGFHPIVEPLLERRIPVYFSLTRSMSTLAEARADLEITELVRTGDDAWGETDLENPEAYAQGEGDPGGPLALGIAVSFPVEPVSLPETAAETEAAEGENAPEQNAIEGDTPEEAEDEATEETGPEEARLVVFGDLDFATDMRVSSAGNSTLLVNTFNWLVQREHLIRIETPPPEQTSLNMTRSELLQVLFVVLLVMPGLAIVFGIWVYLRRRR
ncbi:MAG: GldG family protein [bacterium]|nr:GldG family protein [bacterium]